jgi:hypothetical protein
MTAYTFNQSLITTDADRPARPGFFRKLVAAMVASRQAKAEAEIRRLERVLGRSLRENARPEKIDFDSAMLPFRGE